MECWKMKECPECHAKDVEYEILEKPSTIASGFFNGKKIQMKVKCTNCHKEFERTLADATINGDQQV